MKIELENISKHYGSPDGTSSPEVLKDISLAIGAGDSLAFVGPSGSGKSTLLNVIGGLDKPSSGRVLFNGQDLWDMDDRQLAGYRNNHIGFVFQLHHLLPQLTLMENVLIPLIPQKDRARQKAGPDRAMILLAEVGLGDKIHQRPGQMSVGECQRAAVVRALINEPSFILADEPTGSLDQRSAENLGELLARLNKDFNVAVVVVTHSESLAEKMNAVYHLADGQLNLHNRA